MANHFLCIFVFKGCDCDTMKVVEVASFIGIILLKWSNRHVCMETSFFFFFHFCEKKVEERENVSSMYTNTVLPLVQISSVYSLLSVILSRSLETQTNHLK